MAGWVSLCGRRWVGRLSGLPAPCVVQLVGLIGSGRGCGVLLDTEVHVGLPSGNVRLDFTGAHQHLHLEHLVHLGVHLAGLLGIAAVDMETLSEGDRWRSPPSVAPNLQIRRPSNPA